MSTTVHDADSILNLRQRALARLRDGAPRTSERGDPMRAMAALHALASSPETANDALALLHELQVHQVELDLQQEELRRSVIELEAGIGRQAARVDHAPVAYLTLDASAHLLDLNHAAARLLGDGREALQGQLLTRFLSAGSATSLFTMLAHVLGGATPQRCELEMATDGLPPPRLLALASADPVGGQCLLALVELDEHERSGQA